MFRAKRVDVITVPWRLELDKAPRLSIRIVIWILLSDTDTDTGIGNSIKISANTETAMLSKGGCR